MSRHLLRFALVLVLFAHLSFTVLCLPVSLDSRFAAVLPAMGQADMGYLPSMMMASFMKKLRTERGEAPAAGDEMAAALSQAGSETSGYGGVRALRGHSLRRMFGINQRELMSDRVVQSPFWLDQFNEAPEDAKAGSDAGSDAGDDAQPKKKTRV